MKTHSKSKTLVVGAGGGGISSALLATLRGEDVTLFESHYALGGCASWFRRGEFIYDAGATTLSGVGSGEPLGELFKLLGKTPELYPTDPGITFHLSSGKIVRYHKNFDAWMMELHHHFPNLNHETFWKKIRHINSRSWALLRDVRTFPFQSLSDIKDVLKHPEYISLIPHLLISTEMALKKYGLYHPEYLELINGILIISAQSTSENIPFLVGAMALSYPAETYAPKGGMKGLMDFFQKELIERNVELKLRTRAQSFNKTNITLTNGEVVSGDKVILNLPIWNIAKMTTDAVIKDEAVQRPGYWGALSLYFGMKSEITDLYQQVHLDHPEVKNYFISFSHPDDEKRAPKGFQAVSISTHVIADGFTLRHKETISKIIMDDFKTRFKVNEIKHFTVGTPKTFERYTGRMHGFVGGLPFLYGRNPLKLLSPLTDIQNVYRVGDTVFPGQGLCGVVAGALQLHHRLK